MLQTNAEPIVANHDKDKISRPSQIHTPSDQSLKVKIQMSNKLKLPEGQKRDPKVQSNFAKPKTKNIKSMPFIANPKVEKLIRKPNP